MINPFKLRRIIALFIMGVMPLITYMFTEIYFKDPLSGKFLPNGQWMLIGIVMFVTLLFTWISGMLLKNPFTRLLEGEGLIVFDLSSTGIITPFNIRLVPGKAELSGKLGKTDVNGIFDRENVYNLSEPVNVKAPLERDEEGNLVLKIKSAEYQKSRMAMYHRPALIYDSQIQSLITKDYLSDKEKNTFTEYGLLYLVRKVEELNTAMLNFGRYVVEMTKPKADFFKSGLFWIIVVIALVILGVLFLPSIIDAVRGSAQSSGATLGGVINPV